MILKDMLGYKLVETVHLSGWFPKKFEQVLANLVIGLWNYFIKVIFNIKRAYL